MPVAVDVVMLVAPSGSADAGGRSVPGGHTSVEWAPFMKSGVSGVECTVLSHFKCDDWGEPEIVYAAGRGVHSPTAAAVARPGSAPHPPLAGEAKGSAPRLPSASLVGLVGLSALLLLVSAGVACGVWPG